ncbi:hypothetical protein BC332_01840 [Capsicum chinense]|nr:hypothetical protein BC332_01840 [Capsicum chinense]
MMPIGGGLCWQSYNKETPTVDDSYTLTANRLWEKKMSPEIHRTNCDYIFVTISSVNITPNEGFLKNGKDPYLTVISSGHVLHVFVNGKLNIGVHYDTWNSGVLGSVTLSSLNVGSKDFAKQKWSYKVSLKGESLSLHTLSGSSSIEWVQGSLVAQKQSLPWYKAIFNSPEGFNEKKCQTKCGQPSQRWTFFSKKIKIKSLKRYVWQSTQHCKYSIVRDMTVAGLGLNKFCYAGLITTLKNKEPVRDDIASKIIELVEQSNGWSAVEALSDVPVRTMIGVTEELYNLPTTEYIFWIGGFLNMELIFYHVVFHTCADLKSVEVPYLTSTNMII